MKSTQMQDGKKGIEQDGGFYFERLINKGVIKDARVAWGPGCTTR